jgi:hypothetical protein
MCSHPEHRYEVLPDGQIAEEHVLTDEQMALIVATVKNTKYLMDLAAIGHGIPHTYSFGGGF